jgi:uncharacterized membrane protein YdjX (TVP38/TMEM64 family)
MWLRVLAPVLVSIGGLVMLRLLGRDFLDQARLRELLEPLGEAAPIAFVAILVVRPLLLLPGQLFTAVGGMVFGALPATLYSLLGSFLGTVLLFLLARKLGGRPMRRLAGGHYQSLKKVARKHDFLFALISCINPLFPTDVMLAAAAASGARFWPSVAGMMVGTLPGTFLTAQFGSGLAQGKPLLTLVSAAGMVVSLVAGAYLGLRIYRELSEEGSSEAPPPRREEGSSLRSRQSGGGAGRPTTSPRSSLTESSRPS